MATNGTPGQPADHPQGDETAPNPFNISGKMLMIVGGGGAGIAAVVVVVLLLTGAFGGGGSVGGSVLGYIPGDARFDTIEDINALTNRDGLDEFTEFFQDGGDDSRDTKDIGMDDDNIELFAVVYESLGGDDSLWIA